MSEDRGITYVGSKAGRVAVAPTDGGPRLPKETSGGGGKGTGKPTDKPKLPFGSGKYGQT